MTREEGNVREIDSPIRNKWCWNWIEHTPANDGVCFSAYFRKLNKPGIALCLWCDKEVNYSGKGLSSLIQHSQTSMHKNVAKTRQNNYRLPVTFSAKPAAAASQSVETTYGLHPIFMNSVVKQPTFPKPVCLFLS